MDLEKAIKVSNRISSYLNADGANRRVPRPRVAIGIAPGTGSLFQVAIRSPSRADLDRTLGDGVEDEVRDMADDEVDIQITGEVSTLPSLDHPPSTTLGIGASVGHYRCTAGTLGFFAQRISDGALGFVSNNHVLANCDRGKTDDDVLHPAPSDHGSRDRDVVARLAPGYPKLDENGIVIDAAFATLSGDVQYDTSRIGEDLVLRPELVPLFRQREVLKYGRTTGLTRGRITAFALQNLYIDYPAFGKKLVFNRQIEIRSNDVEQRFSRAGDSGSLVVNPAGNPIGLLFASTGDGRYSYANPIGDVLRELEVRIIA